MAIDFKSLKKLESLPASVQAGIGNDERLVVLVKLREGASRPSYIVPRAQMGPDIFSAEIRAVDLSRIESDAAVESVSLSRQMPYIK
jgi:hypothetical protein